MGVGSWELGVGVCDRLQGMPTCADVHVWCTHSVLANTIASGSTSAGKEESCRTNSGSCLRASVHQLEIFRRHPRFMPSFVLASNEPALTFWTYEM